MTGYAEAVSRKRSQQVWKWAKLEYEYAVEHNFNGISLRRMYFRWVILRAYHFKRVIEVYECP